MGKPLIFESAITKKRIIEFIEEIEEDLHGAQRGDKGSLHSSVQKVRELRLALESKPLIEDEG